MSNRKFNVSGWDQQHYARTEAFAHQITLLYEKAMQEAARIGYGLPFNPAKTGPFSFSQFPQTRERVRAMLTSLASGLQAVMTQGTETEWAFANLKNDALVHSILPTSALRADQLAKLQPRNLEALAAFQQRKTDGLNLSDRVSKYTGQFKREIELALEVGIGNGKSAGELSRDLRQYLGDPEALFRRVRDSRGKLSLSKAAKAYHPGQGVYRSSNKNAQRLARTEINMAYRESDYLRWQSLDFVVGIEVKRSNNPYPCPICPELAGKYPKDFKFVGWHPNCRCHAVSILATPAELRELNRSLLAGEDTTDFTSKNEVTEPHQGWNDWVNDNRARLATAQSVPYFIRDNKTYVPAGPLPAPAPAPPAPPANVYDALTSAGFDIHGLKPDELNTIYHQLMPGFDLPAFDTELEGLLGNVGLTIRNRTMLSYSGSLTFSYDGEDYRQNPFSLQRTFHNTNGTLVVTHDLFTLPKAMQGGGLSKQVFQALYKQYQNAGVGEIHVHANIDVGGYAWARYGFTFRTQADRRMVLFQARQRLSAAELPRFMEFWNDIKDEPLFPLQSVAKSDWGKRLLMGTDWNGIMDLTNPAQLKLFEDYLFGR